MQSATTYKDSATLKDVASCLGKAEKVQIDYIPDSLKAQCRALIESYHGLHGYACLPNILWRTRLGHFIETHREFQQLLKKASTTRSAKKSNDGFVTIATAILSLEILSSDFSGWSAMYPDVRQAAYRILDCRDGGSYTSLMEQYLYPPKTINPAIVAALMPPPVHATKTASFRTSSPETAGEKMGWAAQIPFMRPHVGT